MGKLEICIKIINSQNPKGGEISCKMISINIQL